jgi:magnesium and cobalt exporter, CNNM family
MTIAAFAVAAILLLATATLRAAGAALVRTPRADALHDAADGVKGARTVAELLDHRARLQPALAPVLTGLLVFATIPLTWGLTQVFSGWALIAVFVVMAVLVVLATDIVPRTIGRAGSSTMVYRFAPLLAASVRIGDAANDLVSDEETEVVEAPVNGEEERVLISSVIGFGDTIVREVMMPRTDMVTLPASASTDEAVDVVLAEGRSRLPLTGENLDDIVGLLYARDLLVLYDEHSPARQCGEIARDVYFVPETKPIAELLRDMQAKQRHLAIVVDEFGGTAGLVTIEDLLEEIVGEIVDEYDSEEPMVVALEDEGAFLVDARLDVGQLGEVLGKVFPDDDWDTVGGLILGLAGRVPRTGESFEYDNVLLTAEQVQGRRVARVRVAPR